MFGFRKKKQGKSVGLLVAVVGFLCMSGLLFAGLVRLYNVSHLDLAQTSELGEKVAWGIDGDLSWLLGAAGRIYSGAVAGEPVLELYKKDIDRALTVLQEKRDSIGSYVPLSYKSLYEAMLPWLEYADDVMNLLGSDAKKRYLVALMNSAEIRPNGGFFGSYLLLDVDKGRVTQFQVFDSYYAYYQNTGVVLMLDTAFQQIIGQKSINFISPNVYGFTDIDAGNIKILYEQLFPGQRLDGVVLLSSDLVQDLLPEMNDKLIERQFSNAAVDLIRGEVVPNKKQSYLIDITQYLNDNKTRIVKQVLGQIDRVLSGGYVQIYLPNASANFQNFLVQQGLNTKQSDEAIYLWRMNKSFNKIDSFVNTKYILQTVSGAIVAQSDKGIMNLEKQNMEDGYYDLYIFANVHIPQSYADQIYALTQRYGITLTPRETHILGLSYNRHNQIMIHFPSWLSAQSVEGDLFCKKTSSGVSPQQGCYNQLAGRYHQMLSFDMLSFGNDVLQVVKIRLRKQ